MLLATQNPVEHVGTFPLPEAQLDRFMIRLSIGYPAKSQELDILSRNKNEFSIDDLNPVISGDEIVAIQHAVGEINVADSIKKYITEIVNQTRNHPEITLGGSPRASILLMKSSQALALIRGRDYVSPDDIQYLAKPVLSHRMILKSDIRKRIVKQDEIIDSIINSTKVPLT
jgi:MoxR-like ATPase